MVLEILSDIKKSSNIANSFGIPAFRSFSTGG
jgi:hypothetical protein